MLNKIESDLNVASLTRGEDRRGNEKKKQAGGIGNWVERFCKKAKRAVRSDSEVIFA